MVDTVSGAAEDLKSTASGLSSTAEKTAGEVRSEDVVAVIGGESLDRGKRW